MQHLFRSTDETLGLLFSGIAFLSFINGWIEIGEICCVFLILIFIFRLSWGKDKVHKKAK